MNPYADLNGSGTLLQRYLYGPAANQILARTSASGTTAWYLADHEGSVRDVVSTAGAVLDHVAYDSYGNVTSESSPSNGDRFKFDAMAWDAAIGLYYDNARYYDPATGRFSNQDPLKFLAGDMDLYRFVGNSPLNATDSSGMADEPFDHLNGFIGGVIDYDPKKGRRWGGITIQGGPGKLGNTDFNPKVGIFIPRKGVGQPKIGVDLGGGQENVGPPQPPPGNKNPTPANPNPPKPPLDPEDLKDYKPFKDYLDAVRLG